MDSYTFIVQLTTALGVALPATIVAMIKIIRPVKDVHHDVSGRMDQLLEATRAEAIAIGRKQVRDEIAAAVNVRSEVSEG
jgi:hypothetical protein